ncbi:MAG: carboxypeptidase-like regulatory domain-containing protein [Cyclobacteriaceae bacterium]
MKRIIAIVWLVFSWSVTTLVAQDLVITGTILDEESGDPIPYCNIIIKESFLGTSSNEEGEFILKLDSLPSNIIISNINYQRQEISVAEPGNIEVRLGSAYNILAEVEVQADRFDEYALDLVKKAFLKTRRFSNRFHYGKAFYRQKSKNADAFVELMEIFYDVRFTRNKLEDWQVQEGRYAEKRDQLLNRNFTLLSRLFPVLQPETDDVLLPVHEEAETFYDFYLEDVIQVDERRVGMVSCTPKDFVIKPAMKGKLYIDLENHDVIKVIGEIKHDNFSVIKLTEKDGHWKNYQLKYEITYKTDSIGDLLLDYIQVGQDFDYYIADELKYPVSTTSFLSFYEYYQPRKTRKLGGGITTRQQDREILDRIGYEPKFWENNPVVKRTPIEEEVINAFEENKAFGTIFLNSRDQIALQGSELDDDIFITNLLPKVLRFSRVNSWEKAYLHADKPFYFSGEDLWYKAYVVDAAALYPADKSEMVYIDLIDPQGEIVLQQKLKLFEGKGDGSLGLPRTLVSGTYQLRAYTNWMRNSDADHFFHKEVPIYNSAQYLRDPKAISREEAVDRIDLQFFPEGGRYINRVTSQVAFKAIGPDGNGVDLQGVILDEQDRQVAIFKTLHRGMGMFAFQPRAGKQYFAKLESGEVYALPKAQHEGFIITVRNTNAKSIRVRVEGVGKYRASPFYIIGQSRGSIYYRGRFNLENGTANLEIPKNRLPSGIFQITLFDVLQQPHAERMVFVNQNQELSIRTQLLNDKLEAKKPVELFLEVTDPEGRPVATELSIAITDADQVAEQNIHTNILTYLLLQSDLKGTIESPADYFLKDDRKTNYYLDLVMLTNGWRKFVWPEVLQDQLEPKKYPHEKGITLSGKLVQPGTKKALTNLQVVLMGPNLASSLESVTSDVNGAFIFRGLEFEKGENLIFQVLDTKGKSLPAQVLWQEPVMVPSNFQANENAISPDIEELMQADLLRLQSSDDIDDDRVLEEVVIKADKIAEEDNPFLAQGSLIEPDDKVYYSDIFQLIQAKATGVQVSGAHQQVSISIRGGGMPLFVVDGIAMNSTSQPAFLSQQGDSQPAEDGAPAEEATSSSNDGGAQSISGSNVFDLIGWIRPTDVDHIEVLKGANASFYGVRGGNGVISIYTKRGTDIEAVSGPDPNQEYLKDLGFTAVREFYHPKYQADSEKPILDNRPTIYWNPSLTTDVVGRARIWFYNSDASRLGLTIEGISSNGLPGFLSEIVESE